MDYFGLCFQFVKTLSGFLLFLGSMWWRGKHKDDPPLTETSLHERSGIIFPAACPEDK